MSKLHYNDFCAVILAAGKGKRINANRDKNKVAYEIKGIPMILRTIKLLRKTGVENIVVVVGFAKESVLNLLDDKVRTVEQRKRLGTGHAVKVALKRLPDQVKYVLVVNGDDSFSYTTDLLRKLFETHIKTSSKLTFLSMEIEDPTGLGRVLRNEKNEVMGIIEEKDATEAQKQIKEINPACYVFSVDFLRRYINKIPRSKVTGEYYIVSLVELAVKSGEVVKTLKVNNINWRGVNTHEELKEAEQIMVN